MSKKKVLIDGQLVEVTVCKPSRRKASSSIQKKRYQRLNSAAEWLAWDTGKKTKQQRRGK